MKKIPIDFVSEGYNVQGKFYTTTGEPPFPTVLLLPGFPGNEEDVLELGQRMSKLGVNVLIFNYRGTHQSEGTFSPLASLKDIQSAFEYIRQEDIVCKFQVETSKLILGGYSYGGGMALAYAVNHPETKHVFSIAGTDHGEFVREYKRNTASAEMIDAMFKDIMSPTGPVRASGEPIELLARNLATYDLRLNAPAIADRDLLLIGAWDDLNITIEHHILPLYRALVDQNAQKVQIAAFQDNHAFVRNREELAATIVRWVKSL